MKNIHDFLDIHSHHLSNAGDRTIVNLDYQDDVPKMGYYSIGLHPWQTDMTEEKLQSAMEKVREKSSSDRIVAIGECGIDRLRGGEIEKQVSIFKKHISISENVCKPMIIHAVKSFDILLQIRKEINPSQLWIIHGFRGKENVARQLIEKGFALSYGERFNPLSVAATPADLLFTETDESSVDIEEIRKRIEACRL